ncbi:hypothetical protein, partial [Acetobacter persici]|uniref:hypothetical protein n=1 Tax=Acetobacter persici TaxID=1076596 RepID=UPI001BA60FB5
VKNQLEMNTTNLKLARKPIPTDVIERIKKSKKEIDDLNQKSVYILNVFIGNLTKLYIIMNNELKVPHKPYETFLDKIIKIKNISKIYKII